MPPSAAVKLLFSLAVTVILPTIAKIYAKKIRCVMQFLDVKKAHVWAMAERISRVELPWERKQLHGLKDDMVGRLLRTMCGMRDAASLWEQLVAKKI
jgi:3-methyladenine DNA glycosylase AlkC